MCPAKTNIKLQNVGLVSFYSIPPGNAAGLFLQSQSLVWALADDDVSENKGSNVFEISCNFVVQRWSFSVWERGTTTTEIFTRQWPTSGVTSTERDFDVWWVDVMLLPVVVSNLQVCLCLLSIVQFLCHCVQLVTDNLWIIWWTLHVWLAEFLVCEAMILIMKDLKGDIVWHKNAPSHQASWLCKIVWQYTRMHHFNAKN